IRMELAKVGDEYFVELSMKMAQPGAAISPESYKHTYRMVFGDHLSSQQVISTLAELQELLTRQSIVVLGIPGSGKSTILHHLALRLIGAYREEQTRWIPFFVRLTDYTLKADGGAPPILQFLNKQAVKLVGENHFITRNFEELVRLNRFVFLLDG